MINKKGFTLSELLVALTIVGVVAAITIPSIHKIMPDKEKGIVLKAYKAINDANNDIFGNPGLYMFNDSCNRFILQCTNQPIDGHSDTVKGNNKYPYLLTEKLTLADSSVTFNDGNGKFNTVDGVSWEIELIESDNHKPDAYIITIKSNSSNRNDCFYSSSCKRNPGNFRFAVDKYGTTRAWDALTEAYINNPNDLSDRQSDLHSAANSTTNFSGIPD